MQLALRELPGTGFAVPDEHGRQAERFEAPWVGLYVPLGHWTNTISEDAPSSGQ